MISARHQTQHAIEAANRAAGAAEQANSDSAEHFTEDERPYIFLNTSLHPGAGETANDGNSGHFLTLFFFDKSDPQKAKVYWTFHWKNYGKSPAVNVRVSKALELGGRAFEKWYWAPTVQVVGSVVPPDSDAFGTVVSEPISRADGERFLSTDFAMVLFGHIDYEGLDGRPYWTEFCVERQSNSAMANCPTHSLLMK